MDSLRAAARPHEQFGALLDAVLAFSADLDLSDLLEHVVRSVCTLVGARYGALGVLSADGEHLVDFVTHGIPDEQCARIGAVPRGKGVLACVLREPGPVRLHDLGEHAEALGFPAGHPAMRTFLGVPVRIRDEVYGTIYLAEKEGGEDFTEEDEALVVAVAAAAGVAIDNARLFDRTQRRERWSEALGELTQNLLATGAEDEALGLMAERIRVLTEAAVVGVVVFDEARDLVLRSLTSGEAGRVLSNEHWEQLLASGEPQLWLPGSAVPTAEAAQEIRLLGGLTEPGTTALVPVGTGRGGIGVLVVAWQGDNGRQAAEVLPSLAVFSRQAGLAIVAARAQRDGARLALLEERDRIARDMHDNVVQRLFATGLSLQSAAPLAQHPVVRARLLEAVDALDSAIKEIRQAIFELHTVDPHGGVFVVLEQLVENYAQNLGFVPELVVEGRLGTLPERLRSDVIAVVRECLANIARHASASRVSVSLSVGDDLDIAVSDDGVGMEAGASRSGLVNLLSRARAHGGDLTISRSPLGGTLVRWHVPVER
jgi:signal transduction histidine kinase